MVRRALPGLTLLALFGGAVTSFAQAPTTYHLHKEASTINTANKQLRTSGPDASQTAFQTVNLKNSSGNFASLIANFETQTGVPNRAGTIAAGSTVTFTLRMKVTALPSSGSLYAYAKLRLNSASGTELCHAGGQDGTVSALTTTLTWYTFACAPGSAVSMTASDRFFLEADVWIAGTVGNHNLYGELDVETGADSTVTIAPHITSLGSTSGYIGQSVTINGTLFGATQGSSTAKFNGTSGSVTSWGDTSVAATVPSGATTGPVVITVNTLASNGVTFTVVPHITGISPAAPGVGQAVTISGTTFGGTPGTVTFNGVAATPTNWTDTSISTTVPSGATTGPVVVTASGNSSAGFNLTVITTGTMTGTITRATGGAAVSGATVQAVLTGIVKGTATTAANGTYTIGSLDPGTYDVRVSASGFATELRQNVSIAANVTTTTNASLWQPGSISGVVTQTSNSAAIIGAAASMYLGPSQKGATSTDGSGAYALSSLHPGAYTLQMASVGYRTKEQGVTISENVNTTANVTLDGAPTGPVQYAYDELSRLIQVIDPSGDSAIYHYDAVGNIISIDRAGSSSVAIAGFAPTSGPIGATVTVYGNGFSSTPSSNTVTFHGTAATVSAAAANQLTVTVPAGATTGTVAVTTPNGSATSSTAFTVTAAALGAPTITGFSPSIWTGSGALTITGTNFDTTPANDRVNINVGFATPTTASATSLSVPVVTAATSGHLTVATVAGTAVSSGDFFIPPPGYSAGNVQTTGRMTVGGSAALSFPTSGKFSLRLFDGTQAHRVSAKIDSVTMPSGTAVIYDPWGEIPGDTASVGLSANFTSFIEPFTTESAASYTVLVAPSSSYTGNATVTLYDVPDDVTGPIVPGGADVPTPATTMPGQNVRLSFSGTSGQRVSAALTSTTIALGSLAVLDPDGTEVGSASFSANTSYFFVLDVLTLRSTGTHTLLIDPTKVYTGTATVRLYNVPPDDAGTITINGSPATVTTSTAGQNALRTFTGNPSQQVTVHVTGNAIGAVTVKLLSTDGSTVLATMSSDNSSFDLAPVTLPSNAPQNGTYTITIDPYYGSTGTLNVSVTSP